MIVDMKKLFGVAKKKYAFLSGRRLQILEIMYKSNVGHKMFQFHSNLACRTNHLASKEEPTFRVSLSLSAIIYCIYKNANRVMEQSNFKEVSRPGPARPGPRCCPNLPDISSISLQTTMSACLETSTTFVMWYTQKYNRCLNPYPRLDVVNTF